MMFSARDAAPLALAVIKAMRQRKLKKAFEAYREDWPVQQHFFLAHGFAKARDMVNFVLDMVDMPTPAARRSTPCTPFRPTDLPAIAQLVPEALRTTVRE